MVLPARMRRGLIEKCRSVRSGTLPPSAIVLAVSKHPHLNSYK